MGGVSGGACREPADVTLLSSFLIYQVPVPVKTNTTALHRRLKLKQSSEYSSGYFFTFNSAKNEVMPLSVMSVLFCQLWSADLKRRPF